MEQSLSRRRRSTRSTYSEPSPSAAGRQHHSAVPDQLQSRSGWTALVKGRLTTRPNAGSNPSCTTLQNARSALRVVASGFPICGSSTGASAGKNPPTASAHLSPSGARSTEWWVRFEPDLGGRGDVDHVIHPAVAGSRQPVPHGLARGGFDRCGAGPGRERLRSANRDTSPTSARTRAATIGPTPGRSVRPVPLAARLVLSSLVRSLIFFSTVTRSASCSAASRRVSCRSSDTLAAVGRFLDQVQKQRRRHAHRFSRLDQCSQVRSPPSATSTSQRRTRLPPEAPESESHPTIA